jgi:Ca-activated chloride channel family protein
MRFLLGGAATLASVIALFWLLSPWLSGNPLHFTLAGQQLTLLEPRGLYALSLLPLVVWAPTWSLSDLSVLRRVLSALLRALIMACLALALARPAQLASSQLTSTIFVVDVSSSMSDAALSYARNAIQAAQRARGEHHVALVTFAGEARLEPLADTQPPQLARHAEGDATNIERALSLALGVFEPDRLRQIVLFSDGRETHGQLTRAAERLSRQGVVLHAEVPPGQLPSDVAIRELSLPKTIKVGEPFFVRIRLTSTVAQRVRVKLFQNDVLNGLEGARDLDLPSGESELSLRSIVRVGGPVTYRAEVSVGGPRPLSRSPLSEVSVGGLPSATVSTDRFPDNNHFERTVVVRGRPRVLYVEGEREQARSFVALLESAGFEVDLRGASGAPSSLRELSGFDFYILSNVPKDALGYGAMDVIEPFVELGSGFMMAGGDSSFGLGGYRGSKLEDLLPVRLDTERRRDQPTLALALVIDKSGSMNGPKMELAKEAARATAELLGSQDYLGVIGFDAEPTRVVRLGTAENRSAIARGIGRLASGGGTAIFPALDAAYADLASVRARVKHVILLTDGQTQEDGIQLLVQNMQIDGITVSAIGLGDDVNRGLLEEIARVGNGRAYFTNDPSHVPRLFIKETNAVARSSAVEDYVTARLVAPADFLKSIPLASAPYLRGYVATRARPAPAQVILASDLGEPLLARMHVGLGWSLAWTSDLTPRWSADWFRWPSASAFWAQLIREHMRKDTREVLTIDTRAEGDELVASLDALDASSANERFINGLSGQLRISHGAPGGKSAKNSEQTVPMRQTAPGRYEARAPLREFGSFTLSAVLDRDGKPVLSAQGDFAHPFPAELAQLSPAPDLLALAAAQTGGDVPARGKKLFDPGARRLTFPKERWAWFAWAAAVLFLFDIAARRLRRT